MQDWERRHLDYKVNTALLDIGIIPEHLQPPSHFKETFGRGGFYIPPEGDLRVVCEYGDCTNGFIYGGNPGDTDAILAELNDRDWAINRHYTEDQGRSVLVGLCCPKHS